MDNAYSYSIPKYPHTLPWISTEQMIEVDRLMIEQYHIELIQMMENAGRALALLAKTRFSHALDSLDPIVVLAGTGGNGGGALVCARRLISWGYPVKVFVTDITKLNHIPEHQRSILEAMGTDFYPVSDLDQVEEAALIIDGIIGYSLSGNPRGAAAEMISWANRQASPTLSLDTPSGLDLTSGRLYAPCIQAAATLTLALPKQGLRQFGVVPYRGELYLADISVPPSLYQEPSLNLEVPPIFQESDILWVD